MKLHREVSFEDEVCSHLAAHGWLYQDGDAQLYDRKRALFGPDLIAWLKATQPTAWNTLHKNNGSAAETIVLDRVRKALDERGTLDVLRNGVELVGLRAPLSLVQFRPASGINPDIVSRYDANRLRIVRQ